MFVPCYDACYLRCGKQYSEECDENCDYAKAVLESKEVALRNKELEKILKAVLIYHNNRKCLYCKDYSVCADGNCNDYDKYELDLERIKEDYQIV